jgi:long-chain-acyl-CoA dehydrogenase
MRRIATEPEHEQFRDTFRRFLDKEVMPQYPVWEQAGIIPREIFRRAGELGFLGMDAPEEYGGAGVDDYRFKVVMAEEIQRRAITSVGVGFGVHSDIVLPYLLSYGSTEQRRRWLPGLVSGELIGAIAMTEPGTGSDLAALATTAVEDGDVFLVNGAKTFISNGINADLVIVAVRTDPSKTYDGISLLVVERDTAGFSRGRKLDKIGLAAQDTAELFFDNAPVPAANLLGERDAGFRYMIEKLPKERLSIAVGAIASAAAALETTLAYTKQRQAFGRPIADFQNSRFALAEMATEVEIGWHYVDRCVQALNDGELTVVDAAKAKWWCTEMQSRVLDSCLQLHGGYGYMAEYPISRAYLDARITRIFGGTTEIMKEIVGRSLTS